MLASIRKIFPMFCCLLLTQPNFLNAGEHAQATFDTTKWAIIASVGILSSLLTSKLYDYYYGKQKPENKKNIQTITSKYVDISQNGESRAPQTILSSSDAIIKVKGYVIATKKNDIFTRKNDFFYINDQTVSPKYPSKINIYKKFFFNNYSAIDIPSSLASISSDNSVAENEVVIEIDKTFANNIEIKNENGTLKLNVIPTVPPSAYYVSSNELVKIITSDRHNHKIQDTSNVILQSDRNQNVEKNDINLSASNNSRLIYKDLKTQANINLDTSGLGSIEIECISAKNIRLTSLGNSSIKINNLDANTLSAKGSGMATISINDGKVEEQTLNFSGNATYKAQNLASTSTKVNAQGLSRLFLKVITALTGKASGNSTIQYQGNPQIGIKLSNLATCKQK